MKLKEFKIYRDELIANEQRLMGQIADNIDPLNSLQPVALFKVETSEKKEDSDRLIEEMFKDSEDSSESESQEWRAPKRSKVHSEKFNKRKRRLKPGPKRSYKNAELEREIENLLETEDGKVKCTKCNPAKPILKIYYRQHFERIHLNIKNYVCDRCGRKFYSYTSIEEHMNQHLNLQPFSCPFGCGKYFSNKTSRKTHVKHAHTQDYQYVCEICAMKFKERYSLKVNTKLINISTGSLI